MEIASTTVTFTAQEIEAIATRMHQVVRVTSDSEAARLTAWFYSIGSAISALLTAEYRYVRVSTLEYASLHEMPVSTVRYQCATGKLNAVKDERGWWRIKLGDPEDYTISTMEYAELKGIPLRTVQHRVQAGTLPAFQNESGNWRIKAS